MPPLAFFGVLASYSCSVFGFGALLRAQRRRLPWKVEEVKRSRFGAFAVLGIALGCFVLWFSRPDFGSWTQFGFLFSGVFDIACSLVIFVMLRRVARKTLEEP